MVAKSVCETCVPLRSSGESVSGLRSPAPRPQPWKAAAGVALPPRWDFSGGFLRGGCPVSSTLVPVAESRRAPQLPSTLRSSHPNRHSQQRPACPWSSSACAHMRVLPARGCACACVSASGPHAETGRAADPDGGAAGPRARGGGAGSCAGAGRGGRRGLALSVARSHPHASRPPGPRQLRPAPAQARAAPAPRAAPRARARAGERNAPASLLAPGLLPSETYMCLMNIYECL